MAKLFSISTPLSILQQLLMVLEFKQQLSGECIKSFATSDNSLPPKQTLIHNSKIAVKFEGVV